MNANVTLFLLCAIWLGLTWLYCRMRWACFDLFDLYVMMVAVYYGGHGLVIAPLQDLSSYDPGLIVVIYVLLGISLALLKISVSSLPAKIRSELRLCSIAETASETPVSALVALVSAICLLSLYGYQHYSVVINATSDQVLGIPYWFTSLKMIVYGGAAEGLFVATLVVAMRCSGRRRSILLLLLLATVGLQALYGRRGFLELLILGYLFSAAVSGWDPFAPRKVVRWALALAALFVFSNVYQNYRQELSIPDSSQGEASQTNSKVFTAAMTDWERTGANVRDRDGVWQYNYVVIDNLQRSGSLEGALLVQAVLNEIPAVFWPDKTYLDPDAQFNEAYGLAPNDYATNLFGLTMADFGYAGPIMFIVYMLTTFAVCGKMLSLTKASPTLFILTLGATLTSLLAIESGYDGLFGIVHMVAMVFIGFVVLIGWRIIWHPQPKSFPPTVYYRAREVGDGVDRLRRDGLTAERHS